MAINRLDTLHQQLAQLDSRHNTEGVGLWGDRVVHARQTTNNPSISFNQSQSALKQFLSGKIDKANRFHQQQQLSERQIALPRQLTKSSTQQQVQELMTSPWYIHDSVKEVVEDLLQRPCGSQAQMEQSAARAVTELEQRLSLLLTQQPRDSLHRVLISECDEQLRSRPENLSIITLKNQIDQRFRVKTRLQQSLSSIKFPADSLQEKRHRFIIEIIQKSDQKQLKRLLNLSAALLPDLPENGKETLLRELVNFIRLCPNNQETQNVIGQALKTHTELKQQLQTHHAPSWAFAGNQRTTTASSTVRPAPSQPAAAAPTGIFEPQPYRQPLAQQERSPEPPRPKPRKNISASPRQRPTPKPRSVSPALQRPPQDALPSLSASRGIINPLPPASPVASDDEDDTIEENLLIKGIDADMLTAQEEIGRLFDPFLDEEAYEKYLEDDLLGICANTRLLDRYKDIPPEQRPDQKPWGHKLQGVFFSTGLEAEAVTHVPFDPTLRMAIKVPGHGRIIAQFRRMQLQQSRQFYLTLSGKRAEGFRQDTRPVSADVLHKMLAMAKASGAVVLFTP